MKIKYEFADGDVMEIEADGASGAWIILDRRREETEERTHRRWSAFSLNSLTDKSLVLATSREDPGYMIEAFEEKVRRCREYQKLQLQIEEALGNLTEKQRELVRAVFYECKTQQEFADEKNLNKATVSRRMKAAKKKIRKNFPQED